MSFLNKIYNSKHVKFIPKYFLRKLQKKYNYYYIESDYQELPENNFPELININKQENLLKKSRNSSNFLTFSNCQYLIQILKILFNTETKKINFLDYGAGNIDNYLYLSKTIKNINYFYFDKGENNKIMADLKKKKSLENITILNDLDDVKKNNFDFINLGSSLLYLKNYKLILNSLFDTKPYYIFMSGQIYYEKKVNNNEFITAKQIHTLPNSNCCYFFEYAPFINIFRNKNFDTMFDVVSSHHISFDNFSKKYGKICYSDLLMKNMNKI